MAESNLDRLLEWISRVDTKAAFSLLSGTAMLGSLVSAVPNDGNLVPHAWVAGAAAAILLLINALFVMLAAFPRTRDPEVLAAAPSLFYFGTAASLSLADYRREFRTKPEEGLLDDILSQCHVNSRILSAKFRFLRASYISLYAAAIPWTFCMTLFLTGNAET